MILCKSILIEYQSKNECVYVDLINARYLLFASMSNILTLTL